MIFVNGSGCSYPARKKINRPVYESDMLRGNSPNQKPQLLYGHLPHRRTRADEPSGPNTRNGYYITADLELQGIFAKF